VCTFCRFSLCYTHVQDITDSSAMSPEFQTFLGKLFGCSGFLVIVNNYPWPMVMSCSLYIMSLSLYWTEILWQDVDCVTSCMLPYKTETAVFTNSSHCSVLILSINAFHWTNYCVNWQIYSQTYKQLQTAALLVYDDHRAF